MDSVVSVAKANGSVVAMTVGMAPNALYNWKLIVATTKIMIKVIFFVL